MTLAARRTAPPSAALRCRMCGATRWARELVAREMQFGLPGEFTYGECGECGSLQLLTPPDDPGAYYPPGYYSLSADGPPRTVLGRLRDARDRFALTGRGLLGRAVALLDRPTYPALSRWLRLAGVTGESRILDVGCGSGALLRALAAAGYRRLTGVDPYLASDGAEGPVRLVRGTLRAVDGPFDLVMLHHSLEHTADPAAELAEVRRVLAPGAHSLVRVPTVPSPAFARYGANWVQLDAPRHLVIPSRGALVAAAERCRLALVAQGDDSAGIQYWGSELYARGRTLAEGASTVPWVVKQLARLRAARANARGQGDQAEFLFRAT